MLKPRRRRAVIAGVCAVLVGGGAAAAMIATGSDLSPVEPSAVGPSATPAQSDGSKNSSKDNPKDGTPESPGPSAGAVKDAAEKAEVDPEVVTEATTTIDTTLDSFYAPLEAGEEPKIPGVVGKALREEIEIAQYERQDAGWKVTGSPTLDELEILEVDDPDKPTAMKIKVCVDASDVAIKNSTGRDMTTKTATRSRSVFDMKLVKGEWRAVSRTLPADADCSA
ncbi:hypothetical protein WBG06_05735 [Nocardioides sp. CCNWLW239]|uniref:hypothetical protein n=1 Tax=Nocardioides sp. CCNWLW239 TaxID=3128902 RepID=UPI0030163661